MSLIEVANGSQSKSSLNSHQKRQQEVIKGGIDKIFQNEKRFKEAQETKRIARNSRESSPDRNLGTNGDLKNVI